jgi:hypothetical protein
MSFETLEINGSIHEDPYNQKQIGDLSLYVDWQTREASIEEMDHGITFNVYHGIHSVYNLPGAVDIENFKENVYPRIIPLLEQLANSFEVYWDGNNHRGRFDATIEDIYSIEGELQEYCGDASEICGEICFSVYDCSPSLDRDIIEFFQNNDMDFKSVDLDKIDVDEIKEIMAGDEGVWLCDDDEIIEDLKELQVEINEVE